MTMWFGKKPGSPAVNEAEGAMVIGTPDWVRLPPELGGGQVRVLGSHEAPCPMCQDNAPVTHLELEDKLGVAECEVHGFAWYRRRN